MTAVAEPTRGQVVNDDIVALLRSKHTLLWIETREEERVENALIATAARVKFTVAFWDCAIGFSSAERKPLRDTTDPVAALREIRASEDRRVWIMRDLHKWLADPAVLRHVRSLARDLERRSADNAATIVIMAPTVDVPPELSAHTIVVNYPLPDRREVASLLDAVVDALKPEAQTAVAASLAPEGVRSKVIDAAVGLSAPEIANCYMKSIVTTRRIDPVAVSKEKKSVISREKVVEWFDPDPRGLAALSGCEELKEWCVLRERAFSEEARAFGLPAPKGVMLVGVSGCGKSLFCKCIASSWGLPLLRLDMGALMSKWVGDSESNLRRALATAEAVAPCVLWFDEIEKALAGASGGEGDGGVARRQLGSLLTWMNEKKAPVFCVATANDVSQLPPEFLSKHRFDELWFVDLPDAEERAAIAKVSVRAHGRELDDAGAMEVSTATARFSGAEIASLVPAALFRAFAAGRDLITGDLIVEASTLTPLSVTMEEKIADLRKWAKGRARFANRRAAIKANTTRTVEL